MMVHGRPPVAWRRRRGLPRARRPRPISAPMSSLDDPGRSIASRFTRTLTILDSSRRGVTPLKSPGAGRSLPEVPILAAPQYGCRSHGPSYQRLPGASRIKISEAHVGKKVVAYPLVADGRRRGCLNALEHREFSPSRPTARPWPISFPTEYPHMSQYRNPHACLVSK
jgi:hypothetical protein